MLMMEVEAASDHDDHENHETSCHTLQSPLAEDAPATRLRARKPPKIHISDFEEESDMEWQPKQPGRRFKKRKSRRKKDLTNSDEENLGPVRKMRKTVRRRSALRTADMELECAVCDKTFLTTEGLKEHLEGCGSRRDVIKDEPLDIEQEDPDRPGRCRKYYEQLKTERKFQCELCSKSFITSGHLSTHMYCHTGKKWVCEGCGKCFSCERSLFRHQETFPGDHWFPCPLCETTFFRAINIVKHMEIKHPDAPSEAKRSCELSIAEPIKTDAEGSAGTTVADPNKVQVFMCKKCLKVFYTYEGLKIHKQAMHFMKSEVKAEDGGDDEVEEAEEGQAQPRFHCEVCQKPFISQEGYDYHKTLHHGDQDVVRKRKKTEGSVECKICGSKFPVKQQLQNHLKSHNVTKNMEVKTGTHQCCICPRSFTSSDGLKYHLATHTGERRYGCSQCGKRFIKKTHLSEHIATHSEVKYFKCARCPRTFSTHSAYRKHVKHFPGPHSFPCAKCGKLFTKESMLEKHMCVDLVNITMAPEVKALLSEDMIEQYLCMAEEQAAEHAKTQSLSCYKCFKVFPNIESLQKHQEEHIGKQKYHCRFCSETFNRADTFGGHIRNHLGSTPYMCLKCNRKFISPFTLSMHVKNYPGDHSFTCSKCARWFPSAQRLDKHDCILQSTEKFTCACRREFCSWNELLEHAGQKPFKCCTCECKYPTLMALSRHLKKHTGVKPFKCEICDKAFRAKNNYLAHKNVHRERAVVACTHCDYKTTSQKRLDCHLARKHDVGSSWTSSSLCPVCGIIFPYVSHMKRHLEVEHGQNGMLDEPDDKKALPAVLCTLCGKLLNNKYTLANHMKKVHDPSGQTKERDLKCVVCGERFRTTKQLERHGEVHEAPGLRCCQVCSKEFYYAKDLRKHLRRHDTYKPFSCPTCGKHFKVSVSLKYHSTICRGDGTERPPRKPKQPAPSKEPRDDIQFNYDGIGDRYCSMQVLGR